MKKNKILIVENAVAVTGSVVSVLRSSEYLKDDYDFVFILPKGSKAAAAIQALGFETHYLPMKEIRKKFIPMLLYLPALIVNTFKFRRLVLSLQPDLILNNDFYNLLPPFYKLIGGKVPYLCYVRFLPARFPKVLVSTWCWFHRRFSSGIIAVSNAVKAQLPYFESVSVIGNELPTQPADFHTSHSQLILYPANFIAGKGHEDALASFERVSQKFPDWRLRFVGGDMGLDKNASFKSALVQKAQASVVRDQVEWYDFAVDLSTHYQASAFVLNFSESESFSMTCLEAMYQGKPVIATKSGGPEEIVEHNVNGILVGVRNIEEMSDAIHFMITHQQERELMGQSAYNHVRTKFSAANTIDKLRVLYDSVLKDARSR